MSLLVFDDHHVWLQAFSYLSDDYHVWLQAFSFLSAGPRRPLGEEVPPAEVKSAVDQSVSGVDRGVRAPQWSGFVIFFSNFALSDFYGNFTSTVLPDLWSSKLFRLQDESKTAERSLWQARRSRQSKAAIWSSPAHRWSALLLLFAHCRLSSWWGVVLSCLFYSNAASVSRNARTNCWQANIDWSLLWQEQDGDLKSTCHPLHLNARGHQLSCSTRSCFLFPCLPCHQGFRFQLKIGFQPTIDTMLLRDKRMTWL